MMRFLFTLCAGAVALATSAVSAPLDDVAPQMRKDAECMATVLRSMRDISQVEIGVYRRHGRTAYPYVRFLAAPDKHDNRETISYAAYLACRAKNGTCETFDGRNYMFVATLPGLWDQPRPTNWGTPEIEHRWKAKCGVDATAVYSRPSGLL
jgi:hypothetical protein